jgi:phytoene synthase
MTESLDLRSPSAKKEPDDYVQDLVRQAGSSFLWAMRLLPASRRRAMYGIYAFCRAVDNIADGPAEATEKRAQLETWRHEVDLLFSGKPEHPIMRSLQAAVQVFRLPKAEFLAVIDGMEMDVREPVSAPSQADFTLYCRRVAGAVGLLSIRAFGASGALAEELAIIEGEALQITNILRDLEEDAARGRLYVPAELLKTYGIAQTDPLKVLAQPKFSDVYRALTEMARMRFKRARALISQIGGPSLRPARLMLETYSRLLDRLEAEGWPRTAVQIKVPRIKKLWLVLRYGLF